MRGESQCPPVSFSTGGNLQPGMGRVIPSEPLNADHSDGCWREVVDVFSLMCFIFMCDCFLVFAFCFLPIDLTSQTRIKTVPTHQIQPFPPQLLETPFFFFFHWSVKYCINRGIECSSGDALATSTYLRQHMLLQGSLSNNNLSSPPTLRK